MVILLRLCYDVLGISVSLVLCLVVFGYVALRPEFYDRGLLRISYLLRLVVVVLNVLEVWFWLDWLGLKFLVARRLWYPSVKIWRVLRLAGLDRLTCSLLH